MKILWSDFVSDLADFWKKMLVCPTHTHTFKDSLKRYPVSYG